MDRQISFLAQRLKQNAGSGRLQKPCHILHRNDMRTSLFNFLGQIDIIFKIIFGAVRVQNIAGVADRRFTKLVFLQHRIHRHAHIFNPVEAVKHAEQINAAARCFAHEILDHIVGIGLVADTIRAAQKHLQQKIRRAFTHQRQTLPRVFGQETHRDIEGRPTPAFQRKQVWQRLRVRLGKAGNVVSAHTGSEQ